MRPYFACFLLTACASTTAPRAPATAKLRLRELESATKAPGNVTVYFMSEGEDQGLTTDKLRVLEDLQPISSYEAQIAITNPLPAVYYTLVLVDLSSSVTATQKRETLESTMQIFKNKAGPNHKVAVCAFDGSQKIVLMGDFDSTAEQTTATLASYTPKDPSTNLNGAILHGLNYLNESLMKAEHTVKLGTLVVITDGTDRARWVSAEDMLNKVEDSPLHLFVVGLGGELNKERLTRIGKTGRVVIEPQAEEVGRTFDGLLEAYDRHVRRIYAVSYCSPARAGAHELRVETVTAEGVKVWLDKPFSATGFGPGCDPAAPLPVSGALKRPQRAVLAK